VEPRWGTYDRARAAVESAINGPTGPLIAALDILLFDWNRRFYASYPADDRYVARFKSLIEKYHDRILACRENTIESFSADADGPLLLFVRLSALLGPVGASKALHLLSPSFFTLWDNWISRRHYALK
jgi:hypothetical protein